MKVEVLHGSADIQRRGQLGRALGLDVGVRKVEALHRMALFHSFGQLADALQSLPTLHLDARARESLHPDLLSYGARVS